MLGWRWCLLLFTAVLVLPEHCKSSGGLGRTDPSAHGWLRYGKENWSVFSFLHENCHNVLYRKRRCVREDSKPEMLFVLHGILSCCVNNRCSLSFGLPLLQIQCRAEVWDISLGWLSLLKQYLKEEFQLQKINVWAEGLYGKTVLNLHVVLVKQRETGSHSNVIVPF